MKWIVKPILSIGVLGASLFLNGCDCTSYSYCATKFTCAPGEFCDDTCKKSGFVCPNTYNEGKPICSSEAFDC